MKIRKNVDYGPMIRPQVQFRLQYHRNLDPKLDRSRWLHIHILEHMVNHVKNVSIVDMKYVIQAQTLVNVRHRHSGMEARVHLNDIKINLVHHWMLVDRIKISNVSTPTVIRFIYAKIEAVSS